MIRKFLTATAILLAIAHTNAWADISLDLTTGGASGTVNTGKDFFQQVSPQPTGTGVIEPFLRIQENVTEQGYNSDGAVQFDAKAGTWTHALLLGDVPIVNVGGVAYRQFLLDINQNKGGDGELLSLNELEIYRGTVGNFTGTSGFGTGTSIAGLGTIVYSLDTPVSDNKIELNFLLNPGSGAGDMFAYIANSLFSGPDSQFITLYTAFGNPNASNDGFEEWAVLGPGTAAVPEPSVVVMAVVGLLPIGVVNLRRRLRRNSKATA